MRKPKLFIGSSNESKKIASDLEQVLLEFAEVRIWNQSAFHPGQIVLDELAATATDVDFAVFVIGRDDVTDSRNVSKPSPRDNVIFEAGLFCGVLGRSRVFFVVDNQGTKLPSDWGGVNYLSFDASLSQSHQRVLHAKNALLERFEALKSRRATSPQELVGGRWWQFVLNTTTGAVLSLLEVRPGDGESVVIQGTSWGTDGKRKATYRSTSTTLDPKEGQLSYYWEGEHPTDPQLMPAFGIGKIKFDSDGERAETGNGFFTTTNADLTATLKKSAAYVRATDAEIAVIKGTDANARAALVQSKLARIDDYRV